jgi:hypothetical protein
MIRIIFITSFLFFYNKLNSQSILDIKDAVSTYIVNYKNAIYTNDNSIIHIKPDIKIKKSYILYSKIHKNINSYNIKNINNLFKDEVRVYTEKYNFILNELIANKIVDTAIIKSKSNDLLDNSICLNCIGVIFINNIYLSMKKNNIVYIEVSIYNSQLTKTGGKGLLISMKKIKNKWNVEKQISTWVS